MRRPDAACTGAPTDAATRAGPGPAAASRSGFPAGIRVGRGLALLKALATLAASAALSAAPAFAGDAAQKSAVGDVTASASLEGGLYWYENGRRRALVADTESAAEFAPVAADAGGERTARLVPKSSVPDPSGVAEHSPLLRDARGGAPRALPGGVIVTLHGDPDAATARAALEAAGLQPLRPLVGNRVWLVASPAGLAALEMANRLHESGSFASVQPNWWQPRVLK